MPPSKLQDWDDRGSIVGGKVGIIVNPVLPQVVPLLYKILSMARYVLGESVDTIRIILNAFLVFMVNFLVIQLFEFELVESKWKSVVLTLPRLKFDFGIN